MTHHFEVKILSFTYLSSFQQTNLSSIGWLNSTTKRLKFLYLIVIGLILNFNLQSILSILRGGQT